jgi:hypothetical protein
MKQILLIALFLFFGQAGTKAEGPVLSQTTNSTSPLSLALTTSTARLCAGTPLLVQADLTNDSKDKIVIDLKGLWYQISFRAFRSSGNRSSARSRTSLGDGGPRYEGNYLVLDPGESYKASQTFKLDDEFFNDAGSFEISVTYGQFLSTAFGGVPVWRGSVNSDEMGFKIVRCSKRVNRKITRP